MVGSPELALTIQTTFSAGATRADFTLGARSTIWSGSDQEKQSTL